ncbi:hypothetical protein D3P07_08130 [Paenibacillus sp. 1011MAR3C5]|uniref:hypothetical protein n=1 Tax=Paenibacillus sp. 1011MAR3C5 TaxID=1675787 RepID=UPI000E6CC93F|nr:hypothetical protein [Paenibacillus sp. 1011MAR3C5]RJE90171.1 hypothetical protein D3P07_08130 [Paenibacillus sp. 1011MAR3C5]
MSRSWERKVRKNMSKINKVRKKSGGAPVVFNAEKKDRYSGRNYVFPILLLIFVGMYSFVMQGDPKFEATTMYWVTVACYIILAALFFLRKPYLTIGKDYVQSRRFTGDKRLNVADIKGIRVQDGYVTIMPQKGASWTYSRLLNRFKTDEMAAKLKTFAGTHGIAFDEK